MPMALHGFAHDQYDWKDTVTPTGCCGVVVVSAFERYSASSLRDKLLATRSDIRRTVHKNVSMRPGILASSTQG